MRHIQTLVISGDLVLREQLSGILYTKEHVVEKCEDGQAGLLTALSKRLDLILLEDSLPALDGFSVLSRLRREKQTTVMMFANDISAQKRIDAYRRGVDDYLYKPVDQNEVGLRIDALLRRTKFLEREHQNKNSLSAGKLNLTKTNKQVVYDSQPISLTPIQFRLLWLLVENRNEVLTKAYLYQAVLKRQFSRFDRSLDMHLSRIKKKLVEASMPADRFVTVHGTGYLFN